MTTQTTKTNEHKIYRDPSQRVVVTGLGAITPLGKTVATYWDGLVAGRSGIGPVTRFRTDGYPCRIVGEVDDFNPHDSMDAKDARRMARASQFAVAAAREALADAGFTAETTPEDAGVLLGIGNGSFPDLEQMARTMFEKGGMKINPFSMPVILANMAAAQVAMQCGLKGYSNTVITACAAGTQAIGEAAEVLRRGDAQVIVAGGTEAPICEMSLASFCVLRALSTGFNDTPERASRPFDMRRDGFVAAEAAGLLVLETLEHAQARGARIYAEIMGYASTSDAYHLTSPDPEAKGALKAMERAMQRAGIDRSEVGYIHAHGTATSANDKTETLAIKRFFGEGAYKIPVSSTKSMTGHALGAAGAIGAVATVCALRDGIIPPTINYEDPDPECDLDYVPNVSRRAPLRVAMSNSFGFGGQNASVILRRWEETVPATSELVAA
ncbi:MAG: beta-ketoacyl-ACP synthase II [Thermomicrobiales bacterium]